MAALTLVAFAGQTGHLGTSLKGDVPECPARGPDKPGQCPAMSHDVRTVLGIDIGVVEGVLGAQAVPFAFITPASWKRTVGLTLASKDAARGEAIRRWPLHAQKFARVKDDGRAEAALIAVAGFMRRNSGGTPEPKSGGMQNG